jgi:hypothetical protein
MRASKFLSLIFSLSFLLILTGPTLMLLKAQSEEHAIIESIENETENKGAEDTRELSELDFDKNYLLEVQFFSAFSRLIYGFSMRNCKVLGTKYISPPPDLI